MIDDDANDISENIKLYYQNCNSLRSPHKMSVYGVAMIDNDFDIYVLVETNLDSSIYDSELFPLEYTVYRHDRDLSKTPKSSGGGIAVAVKSKYFSQTIELPTCDTYIESICVQLTIHNKNIYIFAVYIPHWNQSVNSFNVLGRQLSRIIDDMIQGDELILLGDFNLSNLNWEFDDELNTVLFPTNAVSEIEIAAITNIYSNGLFQVCGQQNHNGKLLDLIFCTDHEWITTSNADPLVQEEIHHPSILVDLIITNSNKQEPSKDVTVKDFNFSHADFDVINNEIENINWESIFAYSSDEIHNKMAMLISSIDPSVFARITNLFIFKLIEEEEHLNITDYNVVAFYIVIYDILFKHVPCTPQKA